MQKYNPLTDFYEKKKILQKLLAEAESTTRKSQKQPLKDVPKNECS